ncbi:MAG TPA: hypothetical protein VGL56_04945 [Fimbriimonadaceae bacterium]
MARRLTSLLVLLLATFAGAQPFGAFGYHEPTDVAGFILGRDGFHVNAAGALQFRYVQPYTQWKCTDLADSRVAAVVSTKGLCPRKVKIDLVSPGFELFFETGFSFIVNSKNSPYLTWPDGSVGPDVPTPPIPWVLISFKDSQPPVLISFPSGSCSVRMSGTTGAWTIRSVDVDPHWLHIVAPLGDTGVATSTAAELGALVQKVNPNLDIWCQNEPVLKSMETQSDAVSVTGIWHYDRPGAIIPEAALFAALNGYQLEIKSPTRDLNAPNHAGPVVVSSGSDLVIRFPIQELKPGRALANGMPILHMNAPKDLGDISSIWSLALTNLIASCDRRTRDAVPALVSRYVAESSIQAEPFTRQQVPYDESGTGMDQAAAFALLQQSQTAAGGLMRQTNPFILSLMLRRGWDRWLLECPNDAISRRASAIASIALALAGDTNSRLQAGMLEAGMAAEQGQNLWQWHRGIAEKKQFLEPVEDCRRTLFLVPEAKDPFVQVLEGDLHVVADSPVLATSDPLSVSVHWTNEDTRPQELLFLTGSQLKITQGRNILTMATRLEKEGYYARALPADSGVTELYLSAIPALSLPDYAPPPPYSEALR